MLSVEKIITKFDYIRYYIWILYRTNNKPAANVNGMGHWKMNV